GRQRRAGGPSGGARAGDPGRPCGVSTVSQCTLSGRGRPRGRPGLRQVDPLHLRAAGAAAGFDGGHPGDAWDADRVYAGQL
ncbi:MAG: hypothetical protein MI924_17690, partial [Chloroflexales bacterium]|nr:hypothetical protein [Chloroflexales bacterium]